MEPDKSVSLKPLQLPRSHSLIGRPKSSLSNPQFTSPLTRGPTPTHHEVIVVLGHVDEGGQALAEPHGHLPVHVDGEGFKSLLEATHGVVPEGAGLLAQVDAPHLGQTQAAHGDESWG